MVKLDTRQATNIITVHTALAKPVLPQVNYNHLAGPYSGAEEVRAGQRGGGSAGKITGHLDGYRGCQQSGKRSKSYQEPLGHLAECMVPRV